MDERPPSATAALKIMRAWEWPRCYPDGVPIHPGKDLNFVVNRLAMEGLSEPQTAVLALLCNGELIARGDYRWRMYQRGNFYQLEGIKQILKPLRWKGIADLIADEMRQLAGNDWPSPTVDLDRLGMKECRVFEWEFGDNRFSTAICSPETETFAPTYLEEWFSASEIDVWPLAVDSEFSDPEPEPALPAPKKGGAPRKWDWDGAMLHLVALAHHGANGLFRPDGSDPNQSDIARHLRAWFLDTCGNSPEDSQLRGYGKRFVIELNALELRDANNPQTSG